MLFGQTVCAFRVEGWGGEAASRPDELPGHRTREGQAVPAGDLRPEEKTLSARERDGWGQPVSVYCIKCDFLILIYMA